LQKKRKSRKFIMKNFEGQKKQNRKKIERTQQQPQVLVAGMVCH
jgi:hypothetical protein